LKFSIISSIIFSLIILTIIFSDMIAAQEITCEELQAMPFNEEILYPNIIDKAITCELTISNEQFKLASDEYKKIYVLSPKGDFSFEEQNFFFFKTILQDEQKIEDEISPAIKNFLSMNEDYLLVEPSTNKTIKDVFEKVAKEKISILNENVNEGGSFYLKYFRTVADFEFIETQFESYDNNTKYFTTLGERSTKFSNTDIVYFNLQGFDNFYLKDDGRLGAKTYFGIEICSECDYYISADGKRIDVLSGQFTLKGKSFNSDAPYLINIKEKNELEIIGNDIWGINPENSEIMFKASGKIQIKSDDHYTIGENTFYQQYQNNKHLFDFKTKEKTELYTTSKQIPLEIYDYGTIPEGAGHITFESTPGERYNPCKTFEYSCIYWNPATNSLDVKLSDNQITFNDNNAVISYLDIAQIKGTESKFEYTINNALLEFTSSGVRETGEHSMFPPYTARIIEGGDSYEIISSGSAISTCASPCTTSGAVKTKTTPQITPKLPKLPPSKVDAIMVITGNPFEGDDKRDPKQINSISGLFVWNTVSEAIAQSSKSNLISVFSTNEKFSPTQTITDMYTWKKDKSGNYYKLNLEKQVNDPRYKNMVVIITGHHGNGRGLEYIYSQHYYFRNDLKTEDIQMAKGLTDPKPLEVYDLKRNENVYVVMFSACQTVKMPYLYKDETGQYGIALYPKNVIRDLEKAYPNLRLIIGYDNIAPGVDLIYNTVLNRGVTADSKLLSNPSAPGLIDFTLLENGGFQAFGDYATDIYRVDLAGLAAYRKQNPMTEDGDNSAYADRYWNGKRVAYYYKGEDGNWIFHTNYAYDRKVDLWSRKEVTYKINLTEGTLGIKGETKEILDHLNG
jgi:hypothetical protein